MHSSLLEIRLQLVQATNHVTTFDDTRYHGIKKDTGVANHITSTLQFPAVILEDTVVRAFSIPSYQCTQPNVTKEIHN